MNCSGLVEVKIRILEIFNKIDEIIDGKVAVL